MHKVWMSLFVSLLGVAALPPGARADLGDVDTTFAGGGITFLENGDRVLDVQVDGVNRTYVLIISQEDSHVELRRYTSTGALDNGFSDDGSVAIAGLAADDRGLGIKLAITATGEAVIAAPGSDGVHVWSTFMRFTDRGQIDGTFGTDGIAEVPCCGGHLNHGGPEIEQLAMEPTGVIVAGITYDYLELDSSTIENSSGLVALDRGGAITATAQLGASTSVEALATDGAERVWAIVSEAGGARSLRRYSPLLVPDPVFDGDGIRSGDLGGGTQLGDELQISGNGAFISGSVSSGSTSRAAVARVDNAGLLDPAFGSGGRVTLGDSSTVSALTPAPTAGVAALGLISGRPHLWQLTGVGGGLASEDVDNTTDVFEATPGATHVLVLRDDMPNYTLKRIELEQPKPPSVMAAPTVSTATRSTATVAWSPPSSSGTLPLDGFVIDVIDAPATKVATVSPSAGTRSTTVSGLTPGVTYRFRIAARSGVGTGPTSPMSAPAVPPFATATAFADRQFRDFAWRPSTSSERTTWRDELAQGKTATSEIESLAQRPEWTSSVEPVIRLYYAYFRRMPDTGGLQSWATKRHAGTPASKVSDAFAASSEFKNTYGSLANAAFVRLVYRNVLSREPDAAGLSYWTTQLDDKKKSRGQVMLGFSESSEHKRVRGPEVRVIEIFFGMLRRVPTSTELATWKPQAASTTTAVIIGLLGSATYDTRV